MNGIDIFYDVVLPDFFTLNHQVGTVLGRASYSDGFHLFRIAQLVRTLENGQPLVRMFVCVQVQALLVIVL